MPYLSVSIPYFVVWILWPEFWIYSQGVWFFNKFENIIYELSWWANFDFENLSHKFLKISIFRRFWYKNCTFRPKQFWLNSLLLRRVLYILNLYWNFTIFHHCHLLLIISVLFNWILSRVLDKRYKIPTCNLLLGIKFPWKVNKYVLLSAT